MYINQIKENPVRGEGTFCTNEISCQSATSDMELKIAVLSFYIMPLLFYYYAICTLCIIASVTNNNNSFLRPYMATYY